MFTLKWKIALLTLLAAVFGLQVKQTVAPSCCDQPIVIRDTVLVPGPPIISQVPVPFEVTREVPGPTIIKEVPVPFEVTREVIVEKLVPVYTDKPSAAHAYVAMQNAVNQKFEGHQVLYEELRYSIPWVGGRSRTASSDTKYLITSYIVVVKERSFCLIEWYLIEAEVRFLEGDPNNATSWNVAYKFKE